MLYNTAYLLGVAAKIRAWAQINHERGEKRRQPHPAVYQGSFAGRVLAIIAPWDIDRYPGRALLLSQICGVAENTAKGWIYKGEPIPWRRAQMLADYVRARKAELSALEMELHAYAKDRREAVPIRGRPFPKGISRRSAAQPAD